MSDQPENRTQLQNVDQSLLTEPFAHRQGIRSLRDEEMEAVIGGAAINPSWAKPINKVGNVISKVKDKFRR